MIELSEQQLFDAALRILPGLLASGHFTKPRDNTNDLDPAVLRWDAGKEWKEEGMIRRWNCHAIDVAMTLAQELHRDCFEQPEIKGVTLTKAE